jgi:penicillin-insensitive murein endopeptidase
LNLRSWLKLLLIVAAGVPLAAFADQEPSVCHGTTSNGALENGWKLPGKGPNFLAYSSLGGLLGRTYVHSTVHAIVLEAYRALEESSPGIVFVYGETGYRTGGEFKPHKSHRNGLSVDFMMPIRNAEGESVPLPTGIGNRWGYDIEFDDSGAFRGFVIDFEAISQHLYQLDLAAKRHGVAIWRVILAPELQIHLHHTTRWSYLSKQVQFSKKRSWVRHDEHYHVDFLVPCE